MSVMEGSYEKYYETGFYASRYPEVNALTLARVQHLATPGSQVLDIGAGNGRYAIALAHRGYSVIAVERSDRARDQLNKAVSEAGLTAQVKSLATLEDVPTSQIANCHVALLLFGVAGHMSFAERASTFSFLCAHLRKPAVVMGSVPNRFRRFHKEQTANRLADLGPAPRFVYRRTFGGQVNEFEYTAFSPAELKHELQFHGWKNVQVLPESILSEEMVTSHSRYARLDEMASSALPSVVGYGLFYIARSA